MKYIIYIILFVLFYMSTKAQTVDLTCPNVEWLKKANSEYGSGILFHSYESPVTTRKLINIGAFQKTFQIDTFSIINNNSNLSGYMVEFDSLGMVTWLKTSFGSGRSAFKQLQSAERDKDNNFFAIFIYNQTVTFNGQTYVSSIINNFAQEVSNNVDYAILTIDSNKQTTQFFTIPNLKIQNLSVDTLGNKYVIADYNAPVTINNTTYNPLGAHDALLFKLNAQNQVVWTTPIRGKGHENIIDVSVDKNLDIYITGNFSSDTLQVGNQQIIDTARKTNFSFNGSNIFLAKVTNNGTVQWVKDTKAKRNTRAEAYKIVINQSDIYVLTRLGGAILLAQTNVESNVNGFNTVLIKYNQTNDTWKHLLFKSDVGNNMSLDFILHPLDGKIYATGYFNDSLIIGNKNAYSTENNGFVARINLNTEKLDTDWILIPEADSFNMFSSISSNLDGAIFVTGGYYDNFKLGEKSLSNNFGYSLKFFAKISGLSKAITLENNTYTALDTTATSYQWLDCNNNMQPVTSATNRIFTPANPGNYAVQLSNGACQVISECLGATGLQEHHLAQAKVFPNPFSHSLSISLPQMYDQHIIDLHITDVLGRTIGKYKGTPIQLNQYLADQSPLWASKQLYTLQITLPESQATATYKVVKE